MKIIIYGGAFDPIHKGHILLAKKALKLIKADKLFFVPTFCSPVDKQIKAPFDDRLAMINKIIANEKKMFTSSYEKDNGGLSYIYKTIAHFKENYKNAKIYLLVGNDQYLNITKWKKYSSFKKDVTIIAASRNKNVKLINSNDIAIDNFDVDCSSSDLILHPSTKFLYSSTIKYINDNGLYWYQRLEDNKLSASRIGHSTMVAQLALKIAKSNNVNNPFEAWVAGIYHDIAKQYTEQECLAYLKSNLNFIKNYPSWRVLHPYIGADILKNRYLFKNKRVLDAIWNHTIVERPTTLNKIIYCADKLVPRDDDSTEQRQFLDKIITLCMKNINKGYVELQNFINKKYH